MAAVDGGHTLQLSLNRKSGELEDMANTLPLSSTSLVEVFLFSFYFGYCYSF